MAETKGKYDHLYKDAEEYVMINEGDVDLHPIRINLPSPPPVQLIDGYGLHPDDQYFRRLEIPPSLIELEELALENCRAIEAANQQKVVTGYKVYMEYWRLLDERHDEYKDAIEFIKKVWWLRIYGYWFFNDGVPTYITGDYFDFLNFWHMPDVDINSGYPEYREKDRISYLFFHYLEHTTETFANIDEETNIAIPEEDGTYKMIDTGDRVFWGHVEPKTRRSGATSRGCHKVWLGNSTVPGAYGTIISMEGENARDHYEKKLIPAWQKYPMFLKPMWDGSSAPNVLRMVPPGSLYGYQGLGSKIDYTDAANERKNDGKKLFYSLMDEEGKCLRSDVLERWNVNKLAMSVGGGTKIIGYSYHPSTVEEMNEGGIAYYKLAELSDFYKRNALGQTLSGLARIFWPSYIGMEGFIDRFGHSVIDTPTERQIRLRPNAKFAKIKKGARQVQQEKRDALLREKTPAAMEAYRSFRRKEPMCWADCWIGSSGDMGWDVEKIDRRLEEIRRMKIAKKRPYVRGNFMWEGGRRDGRVIWVPDEEHGKFELAMMLPKEETNLKNQITWFDKDTGYPSVAWEPRHKTKFTCGCDPFRYAGKQESKYHDTGSRQSDGGIAILWEHDPVVDTEKDMRKWKSRKFVLSYRYRPGTQEEFNEDVLMACVYFGAMLYPETNVETTWKYFVDRGYAGYLKYDIDPLTGRKKDRPGFYSLVNSKNALFAEIKDYIEYRCHEEPFDEFLEEVKAIRGPEEMTKYDRLVAHGAALLGSRSNYGQWAEDKDNMTLDINSLGFKKRLF